MKDVKEIQKKYHFSLYWLVPILALIITIMLIWQNTFNKGTLIKLDIKEATGMEVGKTLVKFHSVNVGTVENISLSEDLNGAVVSIRMNPGTDELLHEDSSFWVVKPRIQSNSISGLETILSGVYIQMSNGSSQKYSTHFSALDEAPLSFLGDDGSVSIKLVGNFEKVIKSGISINYKGFPIGAIIDNDYDLEKNKVIYIAKIKKKYAHLVNNKSVFWLDSGIDLSLKTSGFNFNMPSLVNLISGSINVSQLNNEKALPINQNDTFELFKDRKSALIDNSKNNVKFVVFLDKDIQNLMDGSEVTLRGVNVGQVASVPWYENEYEKFDVNKPIPVLIVLDLAKSSSSKLKSTLGNYLAKNQLCAAVDGKNLLNMGSQISLNVDTKRKCVYKLKKYRGVEVIPLITKANFSNEINKFAKKLNELDLKALSDNINSTLASLDKTLKSVDMVALNISEKHTVDKLNETIESFNRNSEIYQNAIGLLNKINKSLNELTPTIKKVGQKSNSLVFSTNDKDVEPKVK
ncbi:MAG: MCE family protein [Aeromonadales bacterium]|nr:MCE family protein [Aeromonadales bacterium]